MPGQNENIFWGPPPAAAEVPTELLYVHVRYIQTKDTPPKTIRRRCKGKKKVRRTYTRFYTLLATLTAASPASASCTTSRWLGGGIAQDPRGLRRQVRLHPAFASSPEGPVHCRGRRRVLRRWWISQAPCVFSAPVPPGDPHRRPGPGAADVFGRPKGGGPTPTCDHAVLRTDRTAS